METKEVIKEDLQDIQTEEHFKIMTNEDLKIPEGFDPGAVNLARAIRKQESNGNYNEVGDNGTSRGAYQWQKGTWEAHAKEAGLDPNDFSPKNQDMVAYKTIKRLKDAGKNVVQIAAIWNGGDENRYDPNYVTKNGLPSQVPGKYDVPAYTKRVNDYYQQLKQKSNNSSYQAGENLSENTQNPQLREEMIAQGQPVSVNPEKATPSFPGQIVRAPLQLAGKFAASLAGIKAAFDDFGDPNQTESKKIQEGRLLEGTGFGNYLGKVYPIGYNEKNTEQPSITSAIGTGLETASYIPIAGGASAGIQAAKAGAKGLLSKAAKKALVSGVEGAVGGALQGAGSGMAQSKPFGEIAKDTAIGTGTGAVLGGVLGGVGGLGGAIAEKSVGVKNALGKIQKLSSGSPISQQDYDIAFNNVKNEMRKASSSLSPVQQKQWSEFAKRTGSDIEDTLIKYEAVPDLKSGSRNFDTSEAIQNIDDALDNLQEARPSDIKKMSGLMFNASDALEKAKAEIVQSYKTPSLRKNAIKDIEGEFNEMLKELPSAQIDENGKVFVDINDAIQLRQMGEELAQLRKENVKPEYFEKPGYKLSKAINESLSENPEMPESFRQSQKEWSKLINAKKYLSQLSTRGVRTDNGFSGEVTRKMMTSFLGFDKGGIPGWIISSLGGDIINSYKNSPATRSMLDRSIMKQLGNKTPIEEIRANLMNEFEKLNTKRANLSPEDFLKAQNIGKLQKYVPDVNESLDSLSQEDLMNLLNKEGNIEFVKNKGKGTPPNVTFTENTGLIQKFRK